MATAKRVVQSDGTVHIMCILDRSGSMGSLASDVIGGFNQFLKEQKAQKGKAVLTLVLFDNQYELVYDRVPLNKVKPLTPSTYFVRGMTALNDAIGRTLNANDDKFGFVYINTDGHENASSEYTTDAVKMLVSAKQDGDWEFLFAGVGIDGFGQGGANYGLARSSTATFAKTAAATMDSYVFASSTATDYRGRMAARVDAGDE